AINNAPRSQRRAPPRRRERPRRHDRQDRDRRDRGRDHGRRQECRRRGAWSYGREGAGRRAKQTTAERDRQKGGRKPLAQVTIGCGIGGPARYLAHTYGCRVDGIDLTPELIETGRVLTERCKLADRVVLQVGNALDLPYPDQTFDVVWCQNVAMNISDKAGLLAGAYRVLKPGGLITSTQYSVGAVGDVI